MIFGLKIKKAKNQPQKNIQKSVELNWKDN